MASLPPTVLENLIRQLGTMPLWIKQVLYYQLRVEMEQSISKLTLDAFGIDDVLQLWIPELTKEGGQELVTPSGKLSAGSLKLLQLCRYRKNIANMTIINQWNLEQASVFLSELVQKEMLIKPKSGIVMATINYLSGSIRLGEYLVKINRLTEDQLDQALRTQKYIEESMGDRTGIANVLINLGYVKKEDTEGVLFLKEESRKAFLGLGDPKTAWANAPGAGQAPGPSAPAPTQPS